MDNNVEALHILTQMREEFISEMLVWLKAKGLWEQCCKDILTRRKDIVTLTKICNNSNNEETER